MSSNRRIALFALVTLLAAGSLFAQSSASATANANARILTPIAIAKVSDLNFGSLVSTTGGTVTVSPAGAATPSAGVTIVTPGSVSAATFNVTGEPSTAYTITLPTSITISNGAQTMAVDTFTSNPGGTGALSPAGTQLLAVGGKLTVGVAQATGSYTGTFNVTVAY
jgi:hypothetical protein